MKINLSCEDKYESQKLSSLIFIKESQETYITKILNIIDNEVVVEIKDKSAHSILLKDKNQVEIFADFIQSVIEKKHKIISTTIIERDIEIVKGWAFNDNSWNKFQLEVLNSNEILQFISIQMQHKVQ